MKRALSVVCSMIFLVLFLPGPADANLMRSGEFEADGWITREKGTNKTSPVEPYAREAFFCEEESAYAFSNGNLFMSLSTSESTADLYFNPDRLVWGVSSRALSYRILQYHTYFSVSDLWDNDPDARMGFQLLETCGLFCDNTDTWIFLDNVLAQVNLAPVPEPATILLIGSGLVSVGLISRMRRKNKTG
ncbi:MAG TPA: PEP-CTERM sorting domain-containing protein [Deltaproteobacteria bacterium]|nr:PEP-CTERM sorting domain-containing protein [Deltaproteobacteria bacterium]HPR51589.1 PEP-CTERM sorting domain-containing protein [Deltaproteobacteria bacterium]